MRFTVLILNHKKQQKAVKILGWKITKIKLLLPWKTTMFKRIIDFHLDKWKTNLFCKPLLLRGARQVGKTYAVRRLGGQFKSFVEVNFERLKGAVREGKYRSCNPPFFWSRYYITQPSPFFEFSS